MSVTDGFDTDATPLSHDDAADGQMVERYLLGELTDADRDRFEAHFFSCARCADDVRALQTMAANTHAAFAAEALAPQGSRARVAEFRPRPSDRLRSWLLPSMSLWAPAVAAVLLLGVAGYQSLVALPALRDQLAVASAPRAIPAAVLRPATRGDDTIVRVSAGEPFVHLSFDLTAATPTAELLCRVVDGNGREAVAVAVPAPPPGLPLHLLLPADRLVPGRHVLQVFAGRDQNRPADALPLQQYAFVVQTL